MPIWLIKIIIGVVFTLAGTFGVSFYGWHKDSGGYNRAIQDAKTAQLEANQKVTQKKRDIKHETQALDRDSIIRELCKSGWVRNPSDCPK